MSKRKVSREYLLRIIDLCKTVEQKRLDPFEVEVAKILEVLRLRLPEWKLPEELCLDAEAIREVAEIVKLQWDWIKHRSSLLYVDSILLTLKMRRMDMRSLARSLLKSMHLIVSIDQLTSERIIEAIEYWNQLMPLEERLRREFPTAIPSEYLTLMDLLRLGVASGKSFSEFLEDLWRELKRKSISGKIPYWDFIGRDTFEETVIQAFLASFLVTYGYSQLESDPITGEIFLVPYEEPKMTSGEPMLSFPISLTYEDWKRWKEGRKN